MFDCILLSSNLMESDAAHYNRLTYKNHPQKTSNGNKTLITTVHRSFYVKKTVFSKHTAEYTYGLAIFARSVTFESDA